MEFLTQLRTIQVDWADQVIDPTQANVNQIHNLRTFFEENSFVNLNLIHYPRFVNTLNQIEVALTNGNAVDLLGFSLAACEALTNDSKRFDPNNLNQMPTRNAAINRLSHLARNGGVLERRAGYRSHNPNQSLVFLPSVIALP